METMDKNVYHRILKKYWGYESFRGIQEEIIESIAAGRDTLGLMPTGGGKSICFQVPALTMEGLCLVISPLVSLMEDQVKRLRQLGIKAATINSGMNHDLIETTLNNCINDAHMRFLYLSPERLGNALFLAKLQRIKRISFICVDEAHCVSQWGYDFRPAYKKIAQIRHVIPYHVPILALTATATPKVVADIQNQLEFDTPNVLKMSFARKNLVYVVRRTDNKLEELKHILSHITDGSAIVYTRSRPLTEGLANMLNENGMTAEAYHAGQTTAQRKITQENWLEGRTRIITATNAFGMGIDKPDVRVVIHYNIPDSPEAYFQEAGRAGRDGEKAYAVLLYGKRDGTTMKQRIAQTFPDIDYIQQTYEDLCYFYEVGIGEGCELTHLFNLNKFCLTFKHYPVLAQSALRLLNNAGYIRYAASDNEGSRIKILYNRFALYDLMDTDPYINNVLEYIMRHISGVFADFCYFAEEDVMDALHLERTQLHELLKKLNERHVIAYIPASKLPTITFKVGRVEKEQLFLSDEVYKDRKNDYKTRIECMIQYAEEDGECRSRFLLTYFGEKKAQRCGMCDSCIEWKQTEKKDIIHAAKLILEELQKRKGTATTQELKNDMDWTDIEDEATRELILQEVVQYSHGCLSLGTLPHLYTEK